MNENPTFTIPKDVIEPIIKAHVSTAIASALGDKNRILETAISHVLNAGVDSRDGSAGRGYSSDIPYIQWLCNNAIKKAVEETLTEELAKHKEVLKKHIAAQLSKKDSPLLKQLANGLVESVATPETLKWRLNIALEPSR